MNLELVTAFLSGIGAVLGAGASLHYVRKRERADCAERLNEVRSAIREGFEMRAVK